MTGAFVFAYEGGGPTAGGPPAANPFILPVLILLMLGFFWFTSRSQKKRDRKRREMLDGIKPKDDVITVGGIRGRVVQVTDEEFVLRVDSEKDVKITIVKTGISRKVGEEPAE